MYIEFLGLTLKDWVIIFTSTLLWGALVELRRLKRKFIQQVQRKFIPQLALKMDEKENAFYLENTGNFLAQQVTVEDTAVMMQDFGYQKKLTLRFDPAGTIKPGERRKLAFKVFDKDYFLADLTGKIFLHLINTNFRIRTTFTNIEGLKFTTVFVKAGTQIASEAVEYS